MALYELREDSIVSIAPTTFETAGVKERSQPDNSTAATRNGAAVAS